MTISTADRKCDMTRIFTEEGVSIPVTVIEVELNRVAQFKTEGTDGYHAVQVATGERRTSRVIKVQVGHSVKTSVIVGHGMREFRLGEEWYTAGDQITVGLFQAGQVVDVTGESKSKDFTNTIKRWNFRGQDNAHDNSVSHRVPGSIGQYQAPDRMFKSKKVSGYLGAEQVTVQFLEVVRVDAERNLLLAKDAILDATGGDVIVRPAVKARG